MKAVQRQMSRRGFSLVELVIVMTALAAILTAAGMLLHLALQMNGDAHRQTYAVVTVGRLAEQFRHDVHQARGEPLVAGDQRAAELHLPGGKIVKWRVDDAEGLVRTEQGGAGVQPAGREDSYALPKGTTATLEMQAQGEARIVAIHIDSQGAGGPSLAIEALAARDLRLDAEEGKP